MELVKTTKSKRKKEKTESSKQKSDARKIRIEAESSQKSSENVYFDTPRELSPPNFEEILNSECFASENVVSEKKVESKKEHVLPIPSVLPDIEVDSKIENQSKDKIEIVAIPSENGFKSDVPEKYVLETIQLDEVQKKVQSVDDIKYGTSEKVAIKSSEQFRKLTLFDDLYRTECPKTMVSVYPNLKNIMHREKIDGILLLQNQVLTFKEEYLNKLVSEANIKYQEFINQTYGIENDPLFTLISEYQRARNSSLDIRSKIKYLNSYLRRNKEAMWSISKEVAHGTGKCKDGCSVEVSQEYSFKVFEEDKFREVIQQVTKLEECILLDSYHLYTEQFTKLKIEQYLYNMVRNLESTQSKNFRVDVSGFDRLSRLKRCIAVLFHFQRQPTRDKKFLETCQEWLKILVYVMVHNGDLSDNAFVLNHVIRCPNGIKKWASEFVQLQFPTSCTNRFKDALNCHCLNHLLLVLHFMLQPAPDRDSFLKSLKTSAPGDPLDGNFTLLDSDGEEEELFEVIKDWSDEDLVSLLNQVSITKLCDHILRQSKDTELDLKNPSELRLTKLFAFTSALLEVLFSGLEKLNYERYPLSLEYICSMIRLVVCYMSDHWSCCQSNFSSDLQAVYDKFFFLAVYKIFYFQKLGVWKFLSALPFKNASQKLLWQIFWIFHSPNTDEDSIYNERDVDIKLSDENMIHVLIEELKKVSESDQVYLLTLYESIVLYSNPEESLLWFIVHETFEIYSEPSLTHLAKECTVIFICMIKRYPHLISALLKEMSKRENDTVKFSVHVFEELSLEQWIPFDKDISLISDWLLSCELSSDKSRVSRILLTRMNWGYSPQGNLFLPIKLHREIAVLILQAYVKFENKEEWSVKYGLNQMLQYTSIRNVTQENEGFVSWAWNLIFHLKLHALDAVHPQWIQIYDGFVEIDDLPNAFENIWLQPLLQSYEAKHPVACYLMLIMTDVGHSVKKLMNEGLVCFNRLIEKQQYLASIQSLYYLLPFFVKSSDELLSQSEFINAISNLMIADFTYFSNITGQAVIGAVLHKIESMIKHQVSEAGNITVECALPLIKIWIKLLFKVLTNPTNKKYNFKDTAQQIYYLMDIVLRISFLDSFTRESAMDLLYSFANPLLFTNNASQPSLWSKLFGPSTEFYTILRRDTLPDYPWLAWALIWSETQQKQTQDLWYLVQKEIYNNDQVKPCDALQKSSSFLKIAAPPLDSLPIYRWGKQIISTQISHPSLPLMWQQFFLYYFQRISPNSQMPRSLGDLYFKSHSKEFFSKLKNALQQTIEYWWNSLQKTKQYKETKPDHFQDPSAVAKIKRENDKKSKECTFVFELYRTFKAFSYWISDDTLHKTSVCFSALDPKYCCERLQLIYNNDKAFWFDLISVENLQENLDKLHSWKTRKVSCSTLNRSKCEENLEQRISRHLKTITTKELICDITFKTATGDFEEIVSSWESLVHLFESNQNIIFEKAKLFTELSSKLKQLNFDFENLVPQKYEKVPSTSSVGKKCFNGSKCRGPAVIKINIYKSQLNKKANENLDKNQVDQRIVHEQLLNLPLDRLCSASVQLENYIRALSKKLETLEEGKEATKIRELGESLFYHELKAVDDVLPAVKDFSPSRQFFSNSIESLGKEFISDQEHQLLPLANAIVQFKNAGVLASSLWRPNIAPVSMLPDIYGIVANAVKNSAHDAAFVLLSKINIKQILKSKEPDISVRQKIYECICTALLACGPDSKRDSLPFYGVLKQHFSILLKWNFPDLFCSATKLCIGGMEKNQLPVDIFYETISCAGCLKVNESSTVEEIGTALKKFSQNLLLPPGQQIFVTSNPIDIVLVIDILEALHEKFIKKRIAQNLYKEYQKYMKPYGLFVSLLCHSLLLLVKDNFAETAHRVHDIWQYLNRSFFPWIHPTQEQSHFRFPWSDEQLENATYMFQMFTITISNLNEILLDLSQGRNRKLLSYCWTTYVDIYIKPGFRHYSLSLCHAELLNLPWHLFYPDSSDIEGMCTVLQSNLYESKEFLAKISLKMQWLDLIKNIISTEPTEYVRKILATLGKLLIISGLDVTLTQNNAHRNKIKVLEELPWNILLLEEVDNLSHLYYSTYDPQKIVGDDPQSSPNFYILQFLKIICSMTPSPVSSNSTLANAKRILYLRHYCKSLSGNMTEKDSPLRKFDNLKKLLPSILNDVNNIIRKTVKSNEQMSCALPLVQEILGFINNVPESDNEELIVGSVATWIKDNQASPLLLPCLQTACRILNRADSVVTITEYCIVARFNVEMTNPSDAQVIWSVILASFRLQSTTKEEFILNCVNKSAFFSLYCLVLEQMPQASTPESKKLLLMNMIDWLERADFKEMKDAEETKCLLLWDKILELSIMLLHEDEQQLVQKMLSTFCKKIMSLGEDKSSSGVLGAIGLGTRSHLSVNFRFLCRIMSTFIFLQMPANAAIRLEPMAPGYMPSDTAKRPPLTEPWPTSLAAQSLENVRALLKNRSYLALQEIIGSAIEFAINPRHCIEDSRQFLKNYAILVFPNQSFLCSLG